MKRKKKVGIVREYIPRWFPWFLLPIIIPLMIWIGYLSFVINKADIFMQMLGILVLVTLTVSISLIFLVTYKKIPIGKK